MRKRKKSNPNLSYDENTKLLEVKPIGKSRMYLFLVEKKIYFETIMLLLVSIAGVIVSIAGVNVAMVANDISRYEQKVTDLEKQPTFILETNATEERLNYIIKNTGGDIKNGSILVDEVLTIIIHNENYEYLGKGYIFLRGYMEKDYSTYDFESNSFTVYTNLEPKPILDIINKVNNIIISRGFFSGIDVTQYFILSYTDYKQENIQQEMIVQNGLLSAVNDEGRYVFKISVDLNDLNDEQIVKEINEQLDLLVRYNSN